MSSNTSENQLASRDIDQGRGGKTAGKDTPSCPGAATIIDGVSKRSALIVALLLGIAAFTVAAVLQGEGDYLLGVLAAVGFWSLLGLIMMMRWTLSLQFWGGIGSWLRNRRN